MLDTHYHDFSYTSDQIEKFVQTGTVFTLLLTDGSIVHFFPSSPATFKDWLLAHSVKDLRIH